MEFWILFSLNLVCITAVIFDTVIAATSNPHECIPIIMIQKTYIFLALKLVIEVLVAMTFPVDFAAKYVNMASNLVFPYLLVSSG